MPNSRKLAYQKKIKRQPKNKKRLLRTAKRVYPSGVIFEYAPVQNRHEKAPVRKTINTDRLSQDIQTFIIRIRKSKKRSFKKLKHYGKETRVILSRIPVQKIVKTLSRKTKTRNNKQVGIALLSIGVFLFIFPTAYKAAIPVKAAFPLFLGKANNSTTNGEPIRVDGALMGISSDSYKPVRLVMPRLAIDLSVIEAPVANGFWELSETSASHGQGSANPGEKGNTVIFAHARPALFGPIRDAKKDDAIYVFTKERWFKYRIVETKLVNPDQLEVIAPTGDETLTLFTCSGFLDSKRYIAIAKRDSTDLDE